MGRNAQTLYKTKTEVRYDSAITLLSTGTQRDGGRHHQQSEMAAHADCGTVLNS